MVGLSHMPQESRAECASTFVNWPAARSCRFWTSVLRMDNDGRSGRLTAPASSFMRMLAMRTEHAAIRLAARSMKLLRLAESPDLLSHPAVWRELLRFRPTARRPFSPSRTACTFGGLKAIPDA